MQKLHGCYANLCGDNLTGTPYLWIIGETINSSLVSYSAKGIQAMSNNQEYNGWTNYETWRVNLEIFDGLEENLPTDPQGLRDYAETVVLGCETGTLTLAQGYALAFLDAVNWNEIWRFLPKDG
jgi:hypothetical protein